MPANRFLFVILLSAASLLLLAGCGADDGRQADAAVQQETAPMDRLPDNRAGDIVQQAITFAAGEWETWADKETLSFHRRTNRFDEDGEITETVVQTHRYVLHPPLQVRIEWEENGQEIVLINDGEQAVKLVDGEMATSERDRNQAWNATFGSHYVFAMPFKLTDPGTNLTYAGRDTLSNGTVADAVRVDYELGAGSAAGMHNWTYYFDADDGRLVANHLQYGSGPDDYSFTEYLDYERLDSLHIPTRRYGYQSNAQAERLERRSEIINEDLRFNAPLSDSLFVVP